MGVEAIAIALHHSRSVKTSTVAVLIGLANHDGDGGAWPTVTTLAHYARISNRQVQREIAELERLGEIKRDIQAGGTVEIAKFDRPNLYHFLLTCPPHCDRTKGHKLLCQGCKKPMAKHQQLVHFHEQCKPVEAVIDPVTPASPGDTQVIRVTTPVSPKPSLELPPRLNEDRPELNREAEPERDDLPVGSNQSLDAERADANSRYEAAIHGSHKSATIPEFSMKRSLGRLHTDNAILKAERAAAIDLEYAFEPCPKRTFSPCTYGPNGRCVDCNAPSESIINPNSGEVL